MCIDIFRTLLGKNAILLIITLLLISQLFIPQVCVKNNYVVAEAFISIDKINLVKLKDNYIINYNVNLNNKLKKE